MAVQHIVVDTDIFVWLLRAKERAALYAPLVAGKRLVLSFASVAELWRGAYAQGYNKDSRRRLEAGIGLTVVAPPTAELTHEWARLANDARAAGHPLGQKAQAHDAWVAATARHFELPLLTGNRRHFEGLPGLDLVDTLSA
ncbi:MAG: PIN domain-containing protein [Thermoleophilaceae bacterium]